MIFKTPTSNLRLITNLGEIVFRNGTYSTDDPRIIEYLRKKKGVVEVNEVKPIEVGEPKTKKTK